MTLAGCFAASLQACGGSTDDTNKPVSGTGGVAGTGITVGGNSAAGGLKATGGSMVYDCVPPSGGQSSYTSTNTGGMFADPAPYTGGRSPTGGHVSTGGFIATDGGAPPTGGTRATGGSLGSGGFIADPVPSGGRVSTGGHSLTTGGLGSGGFIVDAAPGTGGRTAATGGLGSGGFIVDVAPASGGVGTGGRAPATGGLGAGGFIVDMAPTVGGQNASAALSSDVDNTAHACIVDPAPPDASNSSSHVGVVVENWRNSGPRHLLRSSDLALFDPPTVRIQGKVEAGQVSVQLHSDEVNVSLRWQSEGSVHGEGPCVTWTPASLDDALCVVARGTGGVAVATLRARDVPGYG